MKQSKKNIKKPIFANQKNQSKATYKKLLKEGFKFFSGHEFITSKNLQITFNDKHLNNCHYVSLYKGAIILDLFWDGEIEAHIRSIDLKKHLDTFKIWSETDRSTQGA